MGSPMAGWGGPARGDPGEKFLPRVQRVDFATAELFHREHTANLANGGIFLESSESFTGR